MLNPHEQKQNKRWMFGSAAASLVVHAVIAVIALGVVVFRWQEKPEAEFQAAPPTRPKLEPRKLEMKVKVNELQKRSARPKQMPRLASMKPSDIAVPEIKTNNEKVTKLSRNTNTLGASGAGFGSGGGTGSGMGGGGGGFGLPTPMADRCSPVGRMNRLLGSGGTAECEKAVVKSLEFLASRQNADGSWGQSYKAGMTGLALLAFLGHCETPDSPKFGPVVAKAIDWLSVKGANGKGLFTNIKGGHGGVYENGMAAYALAEAASITRLPYLEPVVIESITRIIEGQGSDGGWVYHYDRTTPSDTSVSSWQVQALKAAKLTGLNIPKLDEALAMSAKNMKRVMADDGHFGYRTRGSYTGSGKKGGLTGAGVLSLQLVDAKEYSKEITAGIKAIIDPDRELEKRLKAMNPEQAYFIYHDNDFDYNSPKGNLYAWYYTTNAMFQKGGAHWRKWNRLFMQPVLNAQQGDGSWPACAGENAAGGLTYQGGGNNADAVIYRNALLTLMLEVYYRYLPTGAS
jgi:hypothetical protein